MSQKIKNTKIPQTIDEYDANIAKTSESISQKRIDGIVYSAMATCTAICGVAAGNGLREHFGDIVGYGTYFIFAAGTAILLTRAANKFIIAAVLKNSCRDMEKHRNQLKKHIKQQTQRQL